MVIPEDKVESGSGRRCWVTAKFYGRDEGEVRGKSKRYFGQYDPRGYETRHVVAPTRHQQGYWYTVIERFSTCD